jgi:hypothetical protein
MLEIDNMMLEKYNEKLEKYNRGDEHEWKKR